MIRYLGRFIVLNVTRYTRCAQPGEFADRFVFMTRLAIGAGVSAHQREPVLVSFYGLQGNLPPSDCMAFLTLSAKLTAMYVRMAVGALHPRFCKNQVCVTRAARNARMQSAEGKARLIVVEIRVGPNRAPTDCGVAILTSGSKVPVRVAGSTLHRLCEGGLRAKPRGQK